MFDRFAQAGQNGEAGFGLGLAIAAQAARAIGADLEITSAPGRGTRAQIRVPAARVLSA